MSSVKNMCRLCRTKDNLLDIFDNHSQGNTKLMQHVIYLATGIEIQPTDQVSKQVCNRCCDIAVKLYKYRYNAVANDKLLKERCGQPYSPSITDQHELLRIASRIIIQERSLCENSIVILDDDDLDDSLELLNGSDKGGIVQETLNTSFSDQHSHIGTSIQSDVAKLLDQSSYDAIVNDRLSADQHCSDKKQTKQTATNTEEIPISKTAQISSKGTSTIDLALQKTSVTFNKPPTTKNNLNFAKAPKSVFKQKYKHPSVEELLKTFKGLILPEIVLKSDVSPVISLDNKEINEWYENHLKQKLPNLIIKKLSNSSNYGISASPPTSADHATVPSSKQNVATSSDTSTEILHRKNGNMSPSCNQIPTTVIQRITDKNEFNGDSVHKEHVFNYDNQKENHIPQVTIQTLPLNKPEIMVSQNKDNTTKQRLMKQLHSRKDILAKKNNKRPKRIKRRRALFDDCDYTEVIPEKKKRIYCNKNALKTLNKMDLPYVCPSDTNEQKAIFTSSLELRPVTPLSRPANIETPSLVPVPEVEAFAIPKIFLCSICNKVLYTKQKLIDHKNRHIKCKFCNDVMKNAEVLKKHQNESCLQSIINNKPFIKLTKVDAIPSVIKKYPQAFENTLTNIAASYDNDLHCYEQLDEFENAEMSHRGIISNPYLSSVAESSESENEMIRNLFKKRYAEPFPQTHENPRTISISISNDNAFPGWKITTIKGLFPELFKYKVPIHLKSGPEFSAAFRKTIYVQKSGPMMSWVHKKNTCIQKSAVLNPQNLITSSLTEKLSKDCMSNSSSTIGHANERNSSRLPFVSPVLNTNTLQSEPASTSVFSKQNPTIDIVYNAYSSAATTSQLFSNVTQTKPAIRTTSLNSEPTASTYYQYQNIDSTVANTYSNMKLIPKSAHSSNPSTSKVTNTGYVYQQHTSSVQTKSSNSAAIPHQISQNNSSVQKNQDHYKTLAPAMTEVGGIPLSLPISSPNNFYNVTLAPATIACNTYQAPYNRLIQIKNQSSARFAQHAGVATTINNSVSNRYIGVYTVPTNATSNMQDKTLDPAMMYSKAQNQQRVICENIPKRKNTVAVSSYQHNDNVAPTNNVVTPGNMQNLMLQRDNATYVAPSYYTLSQNYCNQVSVVRSGNQSNTVTSSANVSNTPHIRVKTVQELS